MAPGNGTPLRSHWTAAGDAEATGPPRRRVASDSSTRLAGLGTRPGARVMAADRSPLAKTATTLDNPTGGLVWPRRLEPHASTVPLARSTREWEAPAATRTMLVAEFGGFNGPKGWPHETKRPSVRATIPWPLPRARDTTLIAELGGKPVPRPPQVATVPFCRITPAWYPPDATSTAGVAVTDEGGLVDPANMEPQARTVPSSMSATAWA